MMKHADYEVVCVQDDKVFIVDLDLGSISVTNDYMYVFDEIKKNFPGKRLIYRDTLGRWDEIKERSNVNFYTYNEPIPEFEMTGCPTSALFRK